MLCGGFARFVHQHRPDLDLRQGGLIDYAIWSRYGPDLACSLAAHHAADPE